MSNIKIAVLNEFDGLSNEEIQKTVDALQIQVHRDFAPVWGIDADLAFYPDGNAPADFWQLIILNNTDQASALGYHDITESGLPLGKVFAGSDIQADYSWTVTASHELLEMLGDPDINLTVFIEDKNGSGILYAYENCDACEKDDFGYNINGILVSDFVYPSWFEDFHPRGTQYDFTNKITNAFQILPGGYIGVYYIDRGHGWQQLNADKDRLEYRMRAHIGSRRERRKTPRTQWLKSSTRVSDPSISVKIETRNKVEIFEDANGSDANLNITFYSGGAADTLSATLDRLSDGSEETITKDSNGGTITFSNVSSEDTIYLEGFCTTKAVVTIDRQTRQAMPLPSSFPGGSISFIIIIA